MTESIGFVLADALRDIDFLASRGAITESQARSMKDPLQRHIHLAQPFLSGTPSVPAPAYDLSSQFAQQASLAPAPPPVVRQEQAKALYDYVPQPQDTDELPLRVGDVVVVTEKTSDEWWKGYVQGGSSQVARLFPANYVEPIKQAAAIPALPARATAPPPAAAGGVPPRPAMASPSGSRSRFAVGTARASPAGLETETPEERQARKDRASGVANSNVGRHAIGGFAMGTGAAVARGIF